MNKSRKNKKQTTIITLIFSIISLIFINTIAYSAFSSTMNITGMAHARVETNVRITDFRIASTNNATSSYEEFGKNHINSNINLINSSSTITYYLEITNYGTTDVGIYNITGLPEGVNYQIKNYNLKDKICNTTGKCNSFIKRTYELIISTTATSFNGDIKLEFEFKTVHNITYKNMTGSYINGVIDGESVQINLSNETIKYLDVKSNNVNYTYVNNILTLQNVTSNIEVINVQTNFNYDYTGNYQVFTAEYDGIYQLETWGGQGGEALAGYGAYSTGKIKLNKGDTVYIYVAGQGGISNSSLGGTGGYNGGGKGGNGFDGTDINGFTGKFVGSGGGGGATHIATKQGLLSTLGNNIDSIYIVAGGGGGGSNWAFKQQITTLYAGNGGGITGGKSTTCKNVILDGATQTSGYAFGLGEDAVDKMLYAANGAEGSGGGGGGFYGGYTPPGEGELTNGLGSGGSGYIGNQQLRDKYMMCYNCGTSSEESTKTINTTCTSEQPTKDCTKIGNGYAKITMTKYGLMYNVTYTNISGNYQKNISDGENLIVDLGSNAPNKLLISINETETNNYTYENNILTIPNVTGDINIESLTYNFNYTGTSQTFKVLYSGTYKIETWGAQGGIHISEAGKDYGNGGYSTGEISLLKDQILYIQVGGQGEKCNENIGGAGGYNGGGNGGYGVKDSYTYVGGTGGGGTSCWSNTFSFTAAGSGGGISGGNGKVYSATTTSDGTTILKGATQTTGYAFGQGAHGIQKINFSCGSEGSGGGGGGFYGGYTSQTGEGSNAGGSGGSGYIGNSLLTNKHMACNQCEISTEEATKTIEVTCISEQPTSNCAKMGHGYVKITLIERN